MVLGLRFAKQDTRLLRQLASAVRNGELAGMAANVFEQAAVSADRQEPLEVHCDSPMEVVEMAALYSLHGVTQPVIEELNRV